MTRLDRLRRLTDRLDRGRLSRRDFLRHARALGISLPLAEAVLRVTGHGTTAVAAPVTGAAPVAPGARDREPVLVVGSWAGLFGDAQRASQFRPFEEETGIRVVVAPRQPEISLLEAQVRTEMVEWDIAFNSALGANTLRRKGLIEPIDYRGLDLDILGDVDDRVKMPFGVGVYYWSLLLAYGRSDFAWFREPRRWADLWDVEGYPGRRGLMAMNVEPPPLEIPLLADGVGREALYPIDIDRAFASLDRIRPHVTRWIGFGEGVKLLIHGELAIAQASYGVLLGAARAGAPVRYSFDHGMLYFDVMVIPKGAPHRANAHRFIEFCLRADVQAAFASLYPIGTVSAAAVERLPDRLAVVNLGSPAIKRGMVAVDPTWWGEVDSQGRTNLDIVYDRWVTWIL